MKKHILLAALLLVLSAHHAPIHPLKMCVCDARYQAASGLLTFKFKFFWDDLEAALEKQTQKEIDLSRSSTANDQLLANFVRQYFKLKINDQVIDLNYQQAEVKDVVLELTFTGSKLAPSSQYVIDLRNEILLDVFSDQYNIVRFDFFGNGNLETMRFEKAERRLMKKVGK